MTSNVLERLGVLCAAPWFDEEIGQELLGLVDEDTERNARFLAWVRSAGVVVERPDVTRIAEPLRSEFRQALHAEDRGLYAQALGVFSNHALNGSGQRLAAVMGRQGASLNAHAIACVSHESDHESMRLLIAEVRGHEAPGEAERARDAARILEFYAFGPDRRSEFFRGLELWIRGKRVEAQSHFERVLATDIADHASGVAGHLVGVGRYMSGELSSAEASLTRAVEVLESLDDEDGLIVTLTTLGRVLREQHRNKGDRAALERSRDCLERARNLVKHSSHQEARILQALSGTLFDLGETELALELGEAAVELTNRPEDLVSALMALSVLYRESEDAKGFVRCIDRAAKIAETNSIGGSELARLLNVQAGNERRQQNWKRALRNGKQSLAMGRRLGDLRHIAHASHTLGAIGVDQVERGVETELSRADVEAYLTESREILVKLRDVRGIEMVDRTRSRLIQADEHGSGPSEDGNTLS